MKNERERGIEVPTTVSSLLDSVGLQVMGCSKWNQRVESTEEGVYVVSISDDPNQIKCCDVAPISHDVVEKWINRVSTFTLDGMKPTTEKVVGRLSKFWLPDETILYIGKAGKSLRERVRDYYRTELGNRRPHAGGHWLKTLSILDELTIFWCECNDSEQYESKLIELFVKGVSQKTRAALMDSTNLFPFANLEHQIGARKIRKKHGLRGTTIK